MKIYQFINDQQIQADYFGQRSVFLSANNANVTNYY